MTTLYHKIVVTGATGFVGGRIVEGLQGYGAEVIATGRNTNRRAALEALGARFVAIDLGDSQAVNALVGDADLVIHCAALSSPWGTYAEFYRANVLATQYLRDASLAGNVKRFILISTPSVYFDFHDRINIGEAEPLPLKLVNHYAATKLMAEKMILESNLPAIALRPRAIIGRGDTVIMPRVLEAYHQNKLRIVGHGRNIVSVTPVSNVVHAVQLCMTAGDAALGRAYNITSGEAVLLWEMIGDVLSGLNLPFQPKHMPYRVALTAAWAMEQYSRFISGKEPVLTQYSVGILAKDMTLDIALAKSILGYEPVQTAAEAISEFIEWYKESMPCVI
jgi:nucleoside-diphosphate-sugar epimerase